MAQKDRDAKIQKILANPVYVDEVYPSFAALCKHFDINAPKGKQRQYQKRLFNCFFDFDKMERSNQIVITDTFFDDPKPYPDERTGIKTTECNLPMQNLLLGHKWDTNILLLSREILRILKLVPPYYPYNSEEKHTLAQLDFARKMTRTLESAIHQLQLKEELHLQDSISIVHVIGTRDEKYSLKYELDEEEAVKYHEIVTAVLHEMGYISRFDVYQYNDQKRFWE